MKTGVSPAVLIAVAIITALSTLLAAGISALIAYRTSRRSLEHAAEMSRLDRASEKATQHRSSRREAYAAFLTAASNFHRANVAFEQVVRLHGKGKLLTEVLTECLDVRPSVFETRGIVQVEGPTHMAELSLNTTELVMQFHHLLAEHAQSTFSRDASEAAANDMVRKICEAHSAAGKALSDFTKAARETLEEL